MYREKKSKFGLVLFLLIVLSILGGFFYLQSSPRFEKVKPAIDLDREVYWNPKRDLQIPISDNRGLKSVQVYMSDGVNKVQLLDKSYTDNIKQDILKVKYPKEGILPRNNKVILIVEVKDSSFWNFFMGNKSIKKVLVHIDRKKPELLLISNSYSITKGGTALVIFRAKDKSLDKLYIETNFGKKFVPNPFYKKDYYISLIAWPIFQKRFRAWIVAVDKAGNKSRQRVALYLKDKRYRVSKIKARDNFIDGKIAQLAEDEPDRTTNMSRLEKFRFVNETYRVENEDLIRKITTPVDKNKINNFKIHRFYPLRNGKVVGHFGDHRYYYYKSKDNIISESYHMGIDLASIRQGEIKSSNKGLVVFAKYNGIYGNNLIIYHGLGLYSLYGHCSDFTVDKGDLVKAGEIVAHSGSTGLALGDHLHFGLMVQGVMVRPVEFMDSRWIKLNITDVIKKAKDLIGK